LEEKGDRLQFSRILGHRGRYDIGWTNGKKVPLPQHEKPQSLKYSYPLIDGAPHYIYSTSLEFLFAACISTFDFRHIARVLREAVDRSDTGHKLDLHALVEFRCGGVRYVDQDGMITSGGQVGRAESGVVHTNEGVTLPVTAGLMCGGEQEPTETRNVEPGLEGVPMSDCHSTQAVGLLPIDFFTDPTVLFSGPSSTGFTRIGDPCVTAGHYPSYDLPRFLCGPYTFAANYHDGTENSNPLA
jgi:hypothetical protein